MIRPQSIQCHEHKKAILLCKTKKEKEPCFAHITNSAPQVSHVSTLMLQKNDDLW